jgi:hypothetical protein
MVVDTEQAEVDEALQFALGIRGRYIIAQALKYGIEELSKVPSPYKEVSNIADMQYLKDTLFIFPDVMFDQSEELLKAIEEVSN